MKKNFISIMEFSTGEIEAMLNLAHELEHAQFSQSEKSAAMLFNRPSTRTLVSFEVALRELGLGSIHLDYVFTQLVRGEKLMDTAKTLSQYVPLIIARLTPHEMLTELARSSSVPVINAGSDIEHPCQALGDLYTMKKLGKLGKGKKIVFVGDPADSVANSLFVACLKLGMDFSFLAPKGYKQAELYASEAKKLGGVNIANDVKSAVRDADVIYTNSWAKGEGEGVHGKIKDFIIYQVNETMAAYANNDAIIMHPLPATRGLEISESMLDGKSSVVWQQAKNRICVQKAIVKMLV